MTRIAAPLMTLSLTAVPALAHDGAHTHPHGSEAWITLIVVAIGCAAAAVLLRR